MVFVEFEICLIIKNIYIYFFSSDYADESEGNLAYRITHGIYAEFGLADIG